MPSENPLGIQIKEITKSEEIRIIDEKELSPVTQGPSDFKSSSTLSPDDFSSSSSIPEINGNSIVPSVTPVINSHSVQIFEE